MSPKTILIVDDNDRLRELITETLTRLGYLPLPYSNGDDVLREVSEGVQYDLAIVDLELPVIDGLEVARRLKEAYRERPILILSGDGDYESIGFPHFYKGNLDIDTLDRRIKELLK